MTDDAARVAEGFEAFYARQHPRVFGALALTLRDRDLAAEATDEAMVRTYQRWDRVSGYANPGGWAYRVGLNWARSWHRKLRRETRTETDVAAATVSLPDPAVDAAVAALPLDQRAVVVLRLHLDWTVAEVATALEIAEGTVKSRLARALDRLRDDLEPTSPEVGR